MTGFANLTFGQAAMLAIGLLFLYLAIFKKHEPLVLLPIGFGIILGNIPLAGLLRGPSDGVVGGVLFYLFQGVWLGIFPPLIFLGIGALTDFGPLIANPQTLMLGAAAQLGIFGAYLGALAMGFLPPEAASIGIIGGADGPTAIFLTTKLAPGLLGPISVAAYSYIGLVPLIQPPIMRALTTREERSVVMAQMRKVSKRERILFPIAVTIIVGLLVPNSLSLVGMLMLGNLFRESGVVDRFARTSESDIANITTIFLGVTIGASASAETFFTGRFLGILFLGFGAFVLSTAGGVLIGKLVHRLTGGKVNPLIGAAGVSAVPEAARVAQHLGQEANPRNFLLMHAMGPNVAGVIGSAVAAGVFLAIFG
ncbi:MAG: sodium ion-translocating decarboxylase subunit beta [Bacillota bacterium]|nr:MAG: sodium ion-translocating decarboxylase subunit beta [Bacillota bacterium]